MTPRTPRGVRPPSPRGEDERPPVLGSWPRVYALVLAVLLLQMILYAAFSRAFS